jgi:hypothetical protein
MDRKSSRNDAAAGGTNEIEMSFYPITQRADRKLGHEEKRFKFRQPWIRECNNNGKEIIKLLGCNEVAVVEDASND